MADVGAMLRSAGWRLGHHGNDFSRPYWEHHERYPGVRFDVDVALGEELERAHARLQEATVLLNSWMLSCPPLRGARPTAATRAFLSGAPGPGPAPAVD